MTPTEPYLIRLAERLAELPVIERKPFVTRQRERWETAYTQFQQACGVASPTDSLSAWDYADVIATLSTMEEKL